MHAKTQRLSTASPRRLKFQRSSQFRASNPSAMKMPINGTYVYRSAIAWPPTCTNPITGTRVPRNHNQPISKWGLLLRVRQANQEMEISKANAEVTVSQGQPWGKG